MSIPRRAQRRDGNEKAVIAALLEAGCMVQTQDWCDLTVQTPRGRIVLIEVKTDKGRLFPGQRRRLDELDPTGTFAFNLTTKH